MARRRLSKLGQGMQGMADIYFRHILEQQTADQAAARQADRDKDQAALGLVPKARTGEMQRGMISPDQLSRLEKFVDINTIFPSNQELSSRIGAGMSGAKSPSELPSSIEEIRDLMRASGGETGPVTRQTPMAGGPDTLPSTQYGLGERPELERLDQMRQGREQQLVKHGPVQQMPFYSEKTNQVFNQFVPQSEVSSYGSLPQGPTPQQAGANTLAETQAGTLSPAMTQSKADAENMMSRLTRGSLQADARAQQFGLTSGQQSAYHSPQFTDARVAEAGQIDANQAEVSATNRPLTEGEANAAAAVVPLMNADAKLRELENSGTYLRAMATQAVNSRVLGSVAASTNYFSPEDLQYATAGLDYATQVTKAMSGVQARADERDIFVSVLTVGPQDTTPELKDQKRQARSAFNAAVQLKLRNGAGVAGQALGNAIAQGIIPATILPTLEFTDPVFQGAMEAVLRQNGIVQ